MIEIGINYINNIEEPENNYDNIYKFLVENGYINIIKFPGKICEENVLKHILDLTKKIKTKVDIHGFPGMVAAIYSEQFLKNIKWDNLHQIGLEEQEFSRVSTHMGLEINKRLKDYTKESLEQIYKSNYYSLKRQIKETFGKEVEVGLENIPGGFDFDLETISPEFISNNWKKCDFGVFDISHAKLAAEELNMTYYEYLEQIKNKEKVKILHISGNIDETNKYINKPDKHVIINKTEIKDIIKTIQMFNNIDSVISEYSFSTKYSYEKELIIEAITLFAIVKTMSANIAETVLNFLEDNLEDDISNLQSIIELEQLNMNKLV